MGHTAVARISGWTAAVPQLTVISFTVVSEDTRPEFGPSGSPYEALSHNFLRTLNGDDTAFLSAITFCSCSAGVDKSIGHLVTTSFPTAPQDLQLSPAGSSWFYPTPIYSQKSSSGFFPSYTQRKDKLIGYNLNLFCKFSLLF